jgi:hypothetical protein
MLAMGKKTNINTDVTNGGEFVNGDVSSKANKKLQKKQLYILVVLLFIVILGALFLMVHSHTVSVRKANAAKVEALLESNNCSKSAVDSVSQLKASYGQYNDSIDLLNYRAACDAENSQYKQEVSVLNQEKSFYSKANNKHQVTVLTQQISALYYIVQHPSNNGEVNAQPDFSPAEVKSANVSAISQ